MKIGNNPEFVALRVEGVVLPKSCSQGLVGVLSLVIVYGRLSSMFVPQESDITVFLPSAFGVPVASLFVASANPFCHIAPCRCIHLCSSADTVFRWYSIY